MPNLTENQLIKQMPVSLLVARNPHCLLKKILLVLRDSKFDATAITWVVRIASKSGATVTVLPILAPAPPVFIGTTFEQLSLFHLLSSTCPLGGTLRQVSQYLAEQNIQGYLRLREGTIIDQIQQEIDKGDYDFVVIAADAERSIVRWMMGELVNPLLSLTEVPILIAKPIKRGLL
jgi:nucleotide-binding universal stress UspA family protein